MCSWNSWDVDGDGQWVRGGNSVTDQKGPGRIWTDNRPLCNQAVGQFLGEVARFLMSYMNASINKSHL